MIPLFKVFMSDEAVDKAAETLRSGYIGQGPRVEEFEDRLKDLFYANYTKPKLLTVNAGTSALHLALHLLKKPQHNWDVYEGAAASKFWPGIQHGDEVVTTALTCTATNWPILANGLDLKWVDIDPKTMNMDLDDLEQKLSPKTKVIMVVHWGGYPIDLDKLKGIQERFHQKYGFHPAVIEDGAHAFGSRYNGNLIGTHGNLTAFSFQAIKHLTTVDGGLLITPHDELYDRGKLIRWYGIDRNDNERTDFRCENDIEEWGFKFHMNDVCASVGLGNLPHMNNIISKHQANAKFYDEALKDIPGVELLKRETGFDSAFWIYSLKVENKLGFQRYMKENGVHASQVHERNDKHTTTAKYRVELPNLDANVGKLTHIPVGWWVTEEDRQRVVDLIKAGW